MLSHNIRSTLSNILKASLVALILCRNTFLTLRVIALLQRLNIAVAGVIASGIQPDWSSAWNVLLELYLLLQDLTLMLFRFEIVLALCGVHILVVHQASLSPLSCCSRLQAGCADDVVQIGASIFAYLREFLCLPRRQQSPNSLCLRIRHLT